MKTITFKRPKETINRFCSYEILVDKEPLLMLENGQERTVEIPEEYAGKMLQARMQWVGSQYISVDELKAIDTVEISGNELLNRRLPVAISMIPLIMIAFTSGGAGLQIKILFTIVIILSILVLIGTMTVGKNNWLHVQKA